MNKLFHILLVLVVAVLATGTIVEKYHGNEFALDHIYGSWWFTLLMAAVAAAAIANIIRHKLWHTPYRLLLNLSIVIILLGGALTTWTGQHGTMTLSPGQPCTSFQTEQGHNIPLPFTITLDHFDVVTYPGSKTPMDFVSHVSIDGQQTNISMNNIARHKGYRLYQADYDPEGNSTLSVAHDPLGIAVTYTGYLLLIAGFACMFLSRNSRFRHLLRGLPLILLLLLGTRATALPGTLPRQSADRMGQIQVLYKGRICPLQTLAKDFTTKLYGNATYHGLTPEQVLSGWIFYFGEWSNEPVIKIKGQTLRQQLGMNGKYTSFNNLANHQQLFDQHPLPSELLAAQEKFELVQMVSNSQLLKIYPSLDSTGALNWYSQNDPLPTTIANDEYIFIRKQLGYCQELVVTRNYEELNRVFDKTLTYQQQKAGDQLPSPFRIKAERLYNSLTTGKWLAIVSIAIGLLFFALAVFRSGTSVNTTRNATRRHHIIPAIIAGLLTAFLLLIFVLRWIAGGHAPMAGGFDSMSLMAIAIGLLGILSARRHPLAPSISLMAMGFCLLVAMMSGSNPPITHLMPVLSSPLLTLHVTVIMIAYALFIFAMLGSVAALIRPTWQQSMMRTNLLLIYPAEALLALGIILGAVWANISWGNYWSWDPKEVWALITFIVYLHPLVTAPKHGRQPTGFHIYCIAAFLSVIVTYFGVNLILGGMHAYN